MTVAAHRECICACYREEEVESIDPLQVALDRGSQGLQFINAPLVLDYVHMKFWNTLPDWASRNPLHNTISEGLYSSTRLNDTEAGDPFALRLLRCVYRKGFASRGRVPPRSLGMVA